MDIVTDSAENLRRNGYVILDDLYSGAIIEQARMSIIDNAHLLKSTRPNPNSGHLAGFHRYPKLEHLHHLISTNQTALAVLEKASGTKALRTIGLSDITVNRSQQWHVDLLRGKYQRHIDPSSIWEGDGGGVYKVLLYLQSGSSLKVHSGRHLTPVALDDDTQSEPMDPAAVSTLAINAGALILMDIRLPHRGSSQEEIESIPADGKDKILITTVIGRANHPFTKSMEVGNLERLMDWDDLYGQTTRLPKLNGTL